MSESSTRAAAGNSIAASTQSTFDKYGNRGAVDLYTLGPGVTYKIYDANRLLLKRITFIHNDDHLEPVVLD